MKNKIMCFLLVSIFVLNVVNPLGANAAWRNGFASFKDDNEITGHNTGIQHTLYASTDMDAHIGLPPWDQYVNSSGVSRKKVYYLPEGYSEKDIQMSIKFTATGLGASYSISTKDSSAGFSVKENEGVIVAKDIDMISYSVTGRAFNLVGYRETHCYTSVVYDIYGKRVYSVNLCTELSLYN